MNKQTFEFSLDGKPFIVENGEIAKQAGGSVLIRYGDTVVLSTAVVNHETKDIDFFPLTVSYEEKMYSVGKIPGGFLRREGRPTEHAILTARLIDRPIRPLFPEGFRNEVQVVNTVLSVDKDNSSEMAALIGSSLALSISEVPFNGPVAGVIVGRVDGKLIVNPSVEQMALSDINLTVAGTKYAINMVEAGSKEVSEEEMLEALMFAHEEIKKICAFEEEVIAKCGKQKMEYSVYEISDEVKNYVDSFGKERLVKALSSDLKKLEKYGLIDEITDEMANHFAELEYEDDSLKAKNIKQAKEYSTEIVAGEVRRLISEDKIRPDGRKLDELRSLDSQVDLLPRVHGSALFTRGETQVLSTTTLGPISDKQTIEDLTDNEEKRFMHQYNFPPFSVGETGRIGTPGRREIGHGALGERALSQVIPSEEDFPYTIRVVSDVLESNGSSSQASICAGCMSLMAAGVPIKDMVSGVAMGLISTGDNYSILTDIQGMEDHYGDMDFKVAGTVNGITALQMDIKIDGISSEILREALAQARKGRLEILENMKTAISAPRDHVSKYAPKMGKMKIAVDKIKDVIGTGGKTINDIIERSGNVRIDIDDDGNIVVYHNDQEMIDKALSIIENIVRVVEVNEEFDAKVVRIEKFGAFVELFAGTDALLHVSKISYQRVDKVEDVLKIGDVIRVKVLEIDDKGRINVSHKEFTEKPKDFNEEAKPKEDSKNKEEKRVFKRKD